MTVKEIILPPQSPGEHADFHSSDLVHVTTQLLNTATGNLITTLKAGQVGGVEALAFGPGGTLAVGDESIVATLNDPGGQGVSALAFAPDGALTAADWNGHTYLWSIK